MLCRECRRGMTCLVESLGEWLYVNVDEYCTGAG